MQTNPSIQLNVWENRSHYLERASVLIREICDSFDMKSIRLMKDLLKKVYPFRAKNIPSAV